MIYHRVEHEILALEPRVLNRQDARLLGQSREHQIEVVIFQLRRLLHFIVGYVESPIQILAARRFNFYEPIASVFFERENVITQPIVPFGNAVHSLSKTSLASLP